MACADLILLHAPSVYDFRKRPIMFGPVSDLVPSTAIFETYPLGLCTIGEYLERFDYKVRTINIAYLMLRNPRFDAEAFIRKLKPKMFGIDLHWMPHAHGAIEIARICKKYHPDIPVILGGLSSSVFHKELLEYDCVDFVLRGDSTEVPYRMLMDVITKTQNYRTQDFSSIPNLTWCDASGAIIANELSYSPEDFNLPALDFSYNMKSVIRYRDLWGSVPFKAWLGYPMSASLICRGCTHNCVTCGGSAETFRKHFGRKKVAFRDPELLVADIVHSQKFIPGPVFVLNDFLQAGPDYTRTFIELLGKANLDTSIGFELFKPPSEELYALMSENLKDWSIEVSAESHDDDVRKAFGKGHYTMKELEDSIELALKYGATRFDLYFMIGLPTQTGQSVLETAEYTRDLYARLNNDSRLLAFISPMAPFLDPGSMVFDNPEKYGYKLRAHTVEEHRQLLLEPSWKHIMNYESDYLSRDEMVDVTYEAGLIFNHAKSEAGVIDDATFKATKERIEGAREAMRTVDELYKLPQPQRDAALMDYGNEMKALSESTVCEKSELNWPVTATIYNVLSIVRLWFAEEFGNLVSLGRRPATSKLHEQYRINKIIDTRGNVIKG